ncbi:kif19 [Symbiodinium sp. KB8]|nr:kif19 [Symbiodinium sp. KB8]
MRPTEPSGNPPRPPGLPEGQERPRLVSNAKLRSLSEGPADGRASRDFGEEDTEGAAGRPGAHNILVAVRCRALLPQERVTGGHAIISIANRTTVILEDPHTTAADDYLRLNKSKERRYHFDQACDETAQNLEVYERTTRFLIPSVIQGFNATVFAYGATSAGKTHTMLGYPGEPGIMLLTLRDLFSEVANQKDNNHFEIKCSFLEVYNENVRDLLRPDGDFLDIREDPVKGMCVAGISEVGGLESAEEIMALLHQGNKNRTTESTGANVTSSRSHAVLQVMVHQRDRTADIVAHVNLGKLSMIDLAGSERASQTNNKGMRMIEGANINRSLLALGNCITALSSAVAFVPYRDSKMTRLLKDSLGGNCRTVMIANVSPCHHNYEDTHNTLKYANRAKNIKTKAVRNVVQVNYHVSKYTEIIKDLRSEIQELKAKLAEPPEPSLASEAIGDEGSELDTTQSVKWKHELMTNFEERVRIKRRLIDLAHETKNQMVQKSHAQVGISQWESGRQVQSDIADGQRTPTNIQELQEQLRFIKRELSRTEETTRVLEGMLHENQEKAERLQAELPRRVKNKDMRAFLGLISRIYVMEVENMDMQEMVDVAGPLLEQKELEAEALRLQIQMRDRVIEEQDKLLAVEGKAELAKPKGWIHVPAKASRRAPSTVRWLEEDELGRDSMDEKDMSPATRRRHGSVRGFGSMGIVNNEPAVGIGGSRFRSASEGLPLPSSPGPRQEPPSARERLPPDRGRFKSGGTPPAASGSISSGEFGEAPAQAPRGAPPRPLDVAGRGLGRLPPRPSASLTEEKEAGRAPPAPPPEIGEGSDLDRLPFVEGQNLLNGSGSCTGAEVTKRPGPGARRARKKHQRAEVGAAPDRPPVQLQVEASGLRREQEDSQGSGSEREHASSTSPQPVVKDAPTAAEKRGAALAKLNKRLKAGPENAKHLY